MEGEVGGGHMHMSDIMYILLTRLASYNGILCSVSMRVEGRAKLPL